MRSACEGSAGTGRTVALLSIHVLPAVLLLMSCAAAQVLQGHLPKSDSIVGSPDTAYLVAQCSPLHGLVGRAPSEEWTLVLAPQGADEQRRIKLDFAKLLCADGWVPKSPDAEALYGPATDQRSKTFVLARPLPPGSYALKMLVYASGAGGRGWSLRTPLSGNLDIRAGEVKYVASFAFVMGPLVDKDIKITGRTKEYATGGFVLSNLPALVEALNLGSPGLGDALSERGVVGPIVTAFPEPPTPEGSSQQAPSDTDTKPEG